MGERQTAEGKLLDALLSVQQAYIGGQKLETELFEFLLKTLLELTESEFGFIGKVLYDEYSQPYLKIFSITNIAWNEATRKFYEENAPAGLEFRNMNTLFGHAITQRKTILSHAPASDPRRHGTPEGHPPLKAFLGIPFLWEGQAIGMIGIANKPGGYSEETEQFLQPLVSTCTVLVRSLEENKRIQQEKQRNQTLIEQLLESNQRLAQREEELTASEEELRLGYEQIKRREEELSLLVENAPVPIEILDPEGRTLYVNPAFEAQVGPFYRVKGQKIIDNPQLQQEGFDQWYQRALQGDSIRLPLYRYELESRFGRSGSLWVESTAYPIASQPGQVDKVVVFHHNLTDKVETLSRLQESETNLKALFDSTVQAFSLLDSQGRILAFNRTAQLMTQTALGREIHLGDVILDFAEQLGVHDMRERLNRAFAGELVFSVREVFPSPERSYWLETQYVPIIKTDGRIDRVALVIFDITQRKEDEQKVLRSLQEVEYAQRMLATSANVAKISLDQVFLEVNDNYCRTCGYTADELVGYSTQRVADPQFMTPELIAEITEAARLHGFWMGEVRNRHKNGQVYWVESALHIIKDAQGKPLYMQIVEFPITERKEREEELARLNRELARQNSQLRQFNYITSHNLRAPIANLLGISQLIADPNLEEQVRATLINSLHTTASHADRVIHQLNEILLATQNELRWEEIAFRDLLGEVLMLFKAEIESTEAEIILDLNGPDMVSSVRPYLQSILYNLLSNAIKYREPHSRAYITLSTCEAPGGWSLSVQDQGLGMDLGQVGGRLFGLYRRFHPQIEGRGMGLFMVKTQVEELGGRIEVESAPGQGTRFRLFFAQGV